MYLRCAFLRRLGFGGPPPDFRMWCIRDVCGLVCAILTWMLIFYAEYVVMVVILPVNPWSVYSLFNGTLYNLLAFLAISSHLRTMFSDPVSLWLA